MSVGTISLILNIALLVFLLIGFLAGLVRGVKKSGVRTIWLVLFLVLVFFLSPVISKSLMGVYIGPLGDTIGGFLETQILSIPEIADIYASNPSMQELVLNLPPMILNLVVVILLVLIAWMISGICYLITKAVMNRQERKKQEDNKVYTVMNGRPVVIEKTEKPKRYRFWGGIVGLVGGFVMCLCLFLPITGTVRTVMQYVDTTEPVAAAAEEKDAFEYANVSAKLTELMGEEIIGYLSAVNNSVLVKVSSVGGLDLALYDGISTVNIGGQKFSLRSEVHAVASAYETLLTVQSLKNADGSFDFENLDIDQIEKTINAVFASGLVQSIGLSTAEQILEDAVNGDLIDKLVTDGKLPEKLAGYIKTILTEIELVVTANGGLSSDLQQELLAIVGVAKAAYDSGLMAVVSGVEDKLTKQNVLDICACLNGTHTLSAVEKHDYLHDIATGLFSTDLLKASVVGVTNIGVEMLAPVIEKYLEKGGQDITGENAVVFGKIVQAGIDWAIVSTAVETILDSVVDAKNFVADVVTAKNFDVKTVINHQELGTGIVSAGKILDALKTLPLLVNTDDDKNNFEILLTQANRLEAVNKYINVDGLKTINFAQEFAPLADIFNFVSPVLSAEKINTVEFKNLDFETLETNQSLANFFDGNVAKNIKTAEFVALLEDIANQDVKTCLTILLQDTETFADIKGTMLALYDGLENFVKAGLVDFVLAEEQPALAVNDMLTYLLEKEGMQETTRVQNSVINLFGDDKVCKIYEHFINKYIADQKFEIGEVELGQDLTNFKAAVIDDLTAALPLLMGVYLDLKITDFETINLKDDAVMSILNAILTDNFVGENGNAIKIGTGLDILTNSVALNTTESANVLREIICKKLAEIEIFDATAVAETTDENFWKTEFATLAPTLMLLHTTPADNTENAKTLLKVLISESPEAMIETDGFKALEDDAVEAIVSALCDSKLLRPAGIKVLENLATTFGKMFNGEYLCVLAEDVDLASQKTEIADVIVKLLAINNTDIKDYESIPDALLESQEVPAALKSLLIALKANQTGVFGGVYTLVLDKVIATISNANKAMINLVDAEFNQVLELDFDAFIAQYDDLLDIMKKSQAVLDAGIDAFDKVLDKTEAQDALYNLLTVLDENKDGAFGTATTKIFEYFAGKISAANTKIITLVDSKYEGTLEVLPAEILAQYNSILDILAKLEAVSAIGAESLESILNAQGGDEVLEDLLNAMQENISGVFGAAYNAIFEYMQTTYSALVASLTEATAVNVVWADVFREYKEINAEV